MLPRPTFLSSCPKVPSSAWARAARRSLGYMQSHRTLAGPDEILGVARTFREKRLPIDAVIYLGTEFTPSGWNTRNGEFTWHPGNFPDPKAIVDQLHALDLKVVL